MYPAIVNYLQQNQRPPALGWLMRELGYSSTSVTRDRVNELVNCGWLERNEQGALRVVGARVELGAVVAERLRG
jgi:DNA-binding IclR family transcriptional regulator